MPKFQYVGRRATNFHHHGISFPVSPQDILEGSLEFFSQYIEPKLLKEVEEGTPRHKVRVGIGLGSRVLRPHLPVTSSFQVNKSLRPAVTPQPELVVTGDASIDTLAARDHAQSLNTIRESMEVSSSLGGTPVSEENTPPPADDPETVAEVEREKTGQTKTVKTKDTNISLEDEEDVVEVPTKSAINAMRKDELHREISSIVAEDPENESELFSDLVKIAEADPEEVHNKVMSEILLKYYGHTN